MKKLRIIWGEDPREYDYDVDEYSFNTQGELDAFLSGVDASQGFWGYNIIGKAPFFTVDDLKKEFE